MINLTNHHTSCDSSTYASTVRLNIPYRINKPKQILQNKVTVKINPKSCRKTFNSKKIVLSNFKSKSLLCWRSDIWYLNLRCGFLNLISACHIIWTVVKNNGKIAFVNHGGPQDEKAHLSLIDLLVQTQIKPKAMPRLKIGASTVKHQLRKPDLKSLNSKTFEIPVLSSTSKRSHLKSVPYEQQKKGLNVKPLLALCSLLRHMELTTKQSKPKHTKQNLNQAVGEFPYTKSGLSLCQSKVNGLKTRLNLITYGNETAPAKGYFSNSNATFKSQLSHLLPHGDRKSKLLMRPKSSQVTSFKNCKRLQLTPLDLSKSLMNASNVLEEYEFIRSNERTYVEKHGYPKHSTKSASSHMSSQGHNNAEQNSISHKTTRYATYSHRYYSKAKPIAFAFASSSFGYKKAKINGKQKKPVKYGHHKLSNNSVRPKKRMAPFKNIQDLHDIDSLLVKGEKFKTYLRRPLAKPQNLIPYSQPYWAGTNLYEQMHFANSINSTKQFATNPFISQANLVIFSHPEKSLGLVNQVRNLHIPTIGFVSGNNKLDHQTANIVDFHILGNAENINFVTCALQNFIRLLSRANFQPKIVSGPKEIEHTQPSKHKEIEQTQLNKHKEIEQTQPSKHKKQTQPHKVSKEQTQPSKHNESNEQTQPSKHKVSKEQKAFKVLKVPKKSKQAPNPKVGALRLTNVSKVSKETKQTQNRKQKQMRQTQKTKK